MITTADYKTYFINMMNVTDAKVENEIQILNNGNLTV